MLNVKPKLISLLLLFLTISLGVQIAAANSDIEIISGYFEPSGYYGNHAGYYSWINYCPMCHHYGTLENNPKGTYEGEITCSRCDSDFDGTSGADKYGNGARAWLTPYTPKPKPTISKIETTQPTPLTPLELAKLRVQAHKGFL